METEEYLLKLERNLMIGGGRWVADFTESFREHKIGGVTFGMVVRGNTRGKGFLLSRLVNFFLLPNYLVACFVYPAKEMKKKTLDRLLKAMESYMEDNNLTWSWLVIPKEGPFSKESKRVVERIAQREIGIALVDLNSQEITTNRSSLGRRLPRYIRCFR
ncbi:MAG: hypothetical protein ACE5LG_09435 [Anaerolineae bacterium]